MRAFGVGEEDYQAAVASLREALGDSVFETAWPE
jgi:hypothetical protein